MHVLCVLCVGVWREGVYVGVWSVRRGCLCGERLKQKSGGVAGSTNNNLTSMHAGGC